MRRHLLAALVGAALVGAGGAAARPFDLDDLLASESFGRAAVDPSGRWLVFEERDPYDSAPRFDYNTLTSWALTRLRRVDLRAAQPMPVALPAAAGPGVLLAGFSPSGERLAVYRLQGERWSLGIVTLATGAVVWLPVTPQEDAAGRALQWRSDRELLVIARQDGLAPLTLRRGFILAERMPALWAAAARGDGAHVVMGSGRYASVRRRAPDNQLLSIDVVSGERTVLATGAFTDMELSPDHARVALLAAGPDLQPRADGPVRGPRGLETEASRLRLLDLKSGRLTTPCPGCDVLPQLLSWSPSGHRLLVLDRGPDGLWTSGRLRIVDAASGAVTQASEGVLPLLDENPVGAWTDWMGETPLVLGRRPGANRDDWFRLTTAGAVNLTASILTQPVPGPRVADRHHFSVLAGGRVWTVDAAGLVLAHSAATVRAVRVGAEGARLARAPDRSWPVLLVETGDGAPRSAAITPAGLTPARPAWPETSVLAWSPHAVAAQTIDDRGVGRLVLWRRGRPPQVLATINRRLAETDPMTVYAIRHADADGRTVTSWLYLPPTPGPHPLVVRPYLGAAPQAPPDTEPGAPSFMLNLRLLTAHGYAVLLPALPGPPEGLVEPAQGVARRILRAVDAALADPEVGGRIDPARLAIAGYSFGGYTTLTALTQTDRFRAAVSISGLSDLTALWSGLSPFSYVEPEGGYTSDWRTGAVESTQPRLGRPPWAAPERYVRNSPLYAADRVTTPLLLIHGAQDQVPLAQSEAMYSALFRQGKDAQFVTYFGALHTLTSSGDVRDLYARVFGFLDEHLDGRRPGDGLIRKADSRFTDHLKRLKEK